MDLLDRFRAAVARHPDREAVVAPDGTTVTFDELHTRVRRLSGALVAAGVAPGDRVGVCLARGPGLLTALLGVWSAGGAYVPLDPAYPRARLDLMAADAGLAVVIADDPWPNGIRTVRPSPAGDVRTGRPEVVVPPGAPAYLIYTSGSTGAPKGVSVSRAAVAHLVDALTAAGAYPAEPARVAWNASVSFDASVQQWVRVCRGDTVLTLTEELRGDPAALADFLVAARATDLDCTPSHWSVLRERVGAAAERLPGGLRLFVGGEAIPAEMWRDLAGDGAIRALNLYGPTEAAVDSTVAVVDGAEPHLGPPLPGVGAYVLDDRLRPAGEGELYLAGPGLAHGYHGRAGLTAARFLPDPAGPPGARMYRTGDRVRWRADGSLTYLGRVDHQVKVNGFRVELGEIEATLAAHPAVAAAVVALREHPARGRSLAAYWVPAAGAPADPAPLRAHLREQLPEHLAALPLTPLDALPLGVGGKVDRDRLPDPVESADGDLPAGDLEVSIARAWEQVLGRERVLATDDFFALGGHSLVALRVVADLKKRHGVVIRTRTVYEYPRLRDLASFVARSQRAG
ncbi:non-ribosomal peptide synthetase [Actinoplanes sp. NPDC051851]|uniref:non-ribosomal peptide synthetase n=1 Tax=Actinoplanes sp. NPDC051851 TaxID=3154753 RepID=UPI003422F810